MTDTLSRQHLPHPPYLRIIALRERAVEAREAALAQSKQHAAESKRAVSVKLETVQERIRMWREAYREDHNHRAVQRDLKTWLALANRDPYWNTVRNDRVFKKEQADFARWIRYDLICSGVVWSLELQLANDRAAVLKAKSALSLARVDLADAIVTATREHFLAERLGEYSHEYLQEVGRSISASFTRSIMAGGASQ